MTLQIQQPLLAAHHGKVPRLHAVHACRPFTVEDGALLSHHRLHKDGVQDAQEQRGCVQRPQGVVDLLLCVPAPRRLA